jgi:PAS domain S-box-containing protein
MAEPEPAAHAAADPTRGQAPSALPLLRHARRLLWWTLLPLLLLVAVLGAWQAHSLWQQLLHSTAAEARLQRHAFETLVRDARHHVADMRRWMHQELLRAPEPAEPAIVRAVTPRQDRAGQPDGYTLDELPELLRGSMGQVLWLPAPPQAASAPGAGASSPARTADRPPPGQVLRRAQNLFALIEVAHQRNPDLVWSFYFGWPEQHLALYPWVTSRTVIEDRGGSGLRAALPFWYSYEVVAAGRPEVNAAQQPYWTAPYIDAGGAGLLVTHAAPVQWAEAFVGVVGTDIRLSTLQGLLQRLPGAPWRAWVVDDRGHVLADRQHTLAAPSTAEAASSATSAASSAAPTVPKLAERLPAGLSQQQVQAAVVAPGPSLLVGDQHVIAVNINGAPWTLVLAAPVAELRAALLPKLLPYLLILAGLLLWAIVGQALLRTRVITPVLSIFDYLQRLSHSDQAPAPALSQRWQPWLAMVRGVFERLLRSTQRERLAQALKSAVVDNAQAAVVVSDGQGRIVEFNRAAEATLGWHRQAVLGRSVLETLSPARFHAINEEARQRARQGDFQHLGRAVERLALRADGSEFPVEVMRGRVRVDDEEYYTLSLIDLSERRANAATIERQREALRQSEKMSAMGTLLASVAHELNNPLAIVMGRAALLEDKTAGTPMAADAVRIREAAERCGRIVRAFLNMARQRPAERQPLVLNDLARAAADLLGYTLKSHGVVLELVLSDDLPPVLADRDLLGQVVLNLVVNAQQALVQQTPPRKIFIQTGVARDETTADARVWLRVADNGPGISAAAQAQLFEPFFTTKAEGSGTGLGLSVSRGIVREQGGELVLEAPGSSPCTGASFCLTLPAAAAGLGPDPASQASAAPPAPTP